MSLLRHYNEDFLARHPIGSGGSEKTTPAPFDLSFVKGKQEWQPNLGYQMPKEHYQAGEVRRREVQQVGTHQVVDPAC